MEHRYTAIVLGKRETGETDRLYTFYTEEAGKLSAIARGVRKPAAKLAAQLENGTLAGITIIRGRGMGKIAGAIAEERFSALRSDYTASRLLLSTLDRVRTLTEPDDSDAKIFHLLKEFLELSNELMHNNEKEKYFFLRESFLLKLYGMLGYHIDTSHCIATGEKLSPQKKYVFSARDGACVELKSARVYPNALPVTVNTIKMLRLILSNTLTSLLKIKNGPEETKNIARVSEDLYRWTIRH